MKFDYIIVQAGGRGTRMESLTDNKPKALIPIDNLPMIFHLFRKYPDKKFVVVGDYKFDVLEKYLHAFAEVDYFLVNASNGKGTCAGLKEALMYVPDGESFMLIWSDLILPEEYEFPNCKNNVVGISKGFPCRWKYENGRFKEERSSDRGVAGLFIFHDKTLLADVPGSGEFVKWLQSKGYVFDEQDLNCTREYGVYQEWEKLPRRRCRPFNRVEEHDGRIVKLAVDEQGRELAKKEVSWYKVLEGSTFRNTPKIYSYEPLCMEKIEGRNIYEYADFSEVEKRDIICKLIGCLRSLHNLKCAPADRNSYYEAYIAKTYDRLQKVRDLVPFANDPIVVVNGRRCRNVFLHRKRLEELVMKYFPAEFHLIHGDCTFSNILLQYDSIPMLIDPRGYFGTTALYGDVAYDWAKLYYSLFSNYDQFNLKNFRLHIKQEEVELKIASNKWEGLEGYFFEQLDGEVTKEQMKTLLGIIWLSLTTYAWEDYDSICGAFYNGLYYLEEVL